jgi:hypothetical protein
MNYKSILDFAAIQLQSIIESIVAAQNRYCDNQQKNQRTLNVLKAKLGEERAKYFMTEILFPNIKS